MNMEPHIQTISPNGVAKEEEVDELLADADDDEWEFDENEYDDDPNEFRVHDPLPEYREYKRNLLEVHRMSASVRRTLLILSHSEMVHSSEIDLNPPYQRGLQIML